METKNWKEEFDRECPPKTAKIIGLDQPPDFEEAVSPFLATSHAPAPAPTYSLDLDVEQLIATYGALRTYLKVLASQEAEDLKMVQRVTNLLIEINPLAIKASKALSLKAVGMREKNGRADQPFRP